MKEVRSFSLDWSKIFFLCKLQEFSVKKYCPLYQFYQLICHPLPFFLLLSPYENVRWILKKTQLEPKSGAIICIPYFQHWRQREVQRKWWLFTSFDWQSHIAFLQFCRWSHHVEWNFWDRWWIGTDNKEQMVNEKYQNKNMWFGARQLTPFTLNSSSGTLFNSKFKFSVNIL